MVFEAIREVLRQDVLNDAQFYSLQTYYFELIVPSSKSLFWIHQLSLSAGHQPGSDRHGRAVFPGGDCHAWWWSVR